MTATYIQTVAAIVQGLASIVFLCSVLWDWMAREQDRRDRIIERLLRMWERTADQPNQEELAGIFPSLRQIAFVNEQLKKHGKKWQYRSRL
jgi:hypothetical protein